MFIDFDPAYLFGGSILDPVASASRGFTSKNDKKAKKYLDSLEKYFMDHKVVERVNRLVEEAPDMQRKEIKCHCDAIDHDITRGMLYAE